MRAAVIGAGFAGLAAAVELVDAGMEVVVFEKEKGAGGLGLGLREAGWKWSLDRYYHHIFSGDDEAIKMAKKVGAEITWGKPKSNSWVEGKERQLDSAMSVLNFGAMSWWGRLRMGLGLAVLKVIRRGEWLERYRVIDVLPWLIGKEGYEKVWERMLEAKFGKYIDQVSLSWFWARVVKRTKKLGYFVGGFESLAEKMTEYVRGAGGEVRLGEGVKKVERSGSGWAVNGEKMDMVLVTTAGEIGRKWFKDLEVPGLDYLWGQTLILEMDKGLIDGYWLNILEKDWPFLVLVEQTNWLKKSNYGGKVVVYLGNYLEDGDERLEMSKEELLKLYWPYLKKIRPGVKKGEIKKMWKFQSPFAQPVFPVNYSEKKPSMRSQVSRVYVANMSMVYPWDRGVNFAVEIGKKGARMMMSDYNMRGNE